MLHTVSIWLLVVAFSAAGLFNAIGTRANRDNFVRWGYPHWWHRATGILEITCAALIALPAARGVGLILGAVIVAAAILTVLRYRDLSHLAPLGVFLVMLALGGITF
ncbi:DoxX family protein [Paraburkholderia oxyphila]|uniref:DoxX family protein n=1 Tax=Paraburkholderia oxyphila TaxID=614212 RepID=UPI000480DD6C|nr:DoxX family protein [Paraburkholderia oxyphila]